jgi:peptidyl-prolyl cis-trans isomerase A (cyclophilin A)
MRGNCRTLLMAAGCLALAACSSSPTETKTEAPPPQKEEPKAAVPEKAPDVFKVNLDTSKGLVVVEVHRDWAPIGVDHFYTLVKLGFYDGDRFFRYVRNFIVQFGINGDPKTNHVWSNTNLRDDPVTHHNVRGTVVYATAGPNTRSTQLFINLRNNSASLDGQGFEPFGTVVTGMDVVDSLYSGYGEMPPQGEGPDSEQIDRQGNDYLLSRFPRLDFIKKATIE